MHKYIANEFVRESIFKVLTIFLLVKNFIKYKNNVLKKQNINHIFLSAVLRWQRKFFSCWKPAKSDVCGLWNRLNGHLGLKYNSKT